MSGFKVAFAHLFFNVVISILLPSFLKKFENWLRGAGNAVGDIENFIQDLKKRDGKEIALYGGAGLLAAFLDRGLIDEISMTVVPYFWGQENPWSAN